MTLLPQLIYLKQKLNRLADYNQQSRIHALKSFPPNCFIKRDDELSFSISGSKLRKYLSLIPYLTNCRAKEAVLIGGAYSNNILGLSQLLIERSIKPILFLLGNDKNKKVGNFLLTSLFVPTSSIHWITREEWSQVETFTAAYASEKNAIVIPEGALMPEALPGAITLPLDILRNEESLGEKFNHIFVEAGSGLTAIATVLTFAFLEKRISIHVLLLADEEDTFIQKLQIFKKHFEHLVSQTLSWERIEKRFTLHSPSTAKSFGAVNKTILQEIKHIARTEGFLTDPIYSIKLFMEARRIITEQKLEGNSLIVHSGGGLSLLGFQEQLSSI